MIVMVNLANYHIQRIILTITHMMVAYLKSGLGKKYTDMLNSTKNPLKPGYIIYSHPDGSKTRINL
jgi:hypothetical protein